MDWIGLVFRVAHILAAIALVGGAFCLRAVIVPSLGSLTGEAADELREAIRRRWAKVVMTAVLFLIVSGFYNLVAIIQLHKQPAAPLPAYYHPLIGIKILLAFFIFYVASMLAGRTAAAVRFRQRATFWMNLNLAAAITVVAIAGALKTGSKPTPSLEQHVQEAPFSEDIPSQE